MSKSLSWIPLSLIGALFYGTFSFMLSFVDDKIKKSESAQFGYGMILAIASGILAAIMYAIWRIKEKNTAIMLEKNISWKIVALTLVVSIMITPMHALVINQGGSVGQQMMYALAIIPVLIGSRIFFNERLNNKQIAGLMLAGLGAFLMGSKTAETFDAIES
tara:strand:+ start:1562 stop:2047 length:486 start_codon:yes stop_codon:yes gene_type:complete